METVVNLSPIALTLLIAYAGGALFQRIKQPALIGYMLMGAIAGPIFFHGSEHTIHWLAELAVILLMFMLGLELDIERFRRSMKTALLVAFLQIILGLLIMTWISLYFGWTWQLAVLLGFVVALSSTAVAVGMLDTLKETNSAIGRLAIAILVAQDLAVIPMLLVINTLGAGTLSAGALFHSGISVGVIVLSLVAIFELHSHPHWVARLESLFRATVQQPVIAGLALAFCAAALSGALGLSNAYGAFAVGLLVGNVGHIGASYRKAVHSIHDLLMMTFFLSIGLLLDIPFILSHWIEIIVVLGATLLLKTVVNYGIVHYIGKEPRRISLTLGAVLGQIGEFSFVLIALGLANGFINHKDYQIALAVIALSLACSPLWTQLIKRYLLTHQG